MKNHPVRERRDGPARAGASPLVSILAIIALGVLPAAVACGGQQVPAGEEGEETAETPGKAQEGETPEEPQADDSPYDASVLEDPSRTDDDRYRDEGFKPLQVYSFFGVEEGMTVVDLWTSRLYNAHILSNIVGPDGKVLATIWESGDPPEEYAQRTREAYEQRKADGGVENVELVDTLDDVPDGSVDMLITVRNYHDLGDQQARLDALPNWMRVLKPGGILGVVDAHTDKADERDEEHHRINADLAREEITSAGFEFVESSDVLDNPEDTYEFDGREDDAPIHRYFIHRFVHKYRKPAE